MRSWTLFRTASLVLACLSFSLSGQEITGTITGVVTDATGAVVPSATIVARNEGTNATRNVLTNDLGVYTLRALPVGVYGLSAEAPGFKRYETTGVRVQVNQVARVDIAMQVGQVTETVEVTTNVITVNTQDATLRTVIDERRLEDLPLNGRNPVDLILLAPGVAPYRGSGVTSGTTYPVSEGVTVNGGRGNTTNFLLDGGQNNDHYSNMPNPMPNPDALQEFSVQTNNFSAEFGRNSGAVVNAVTKSGTNDLHGTSFWYLRHHALNAANFFAPADPDNPNEKQDDGLKRNQFGATLGGPVVIPKLYDGHDKTFFFFSYQGTRERRRPTSRFLNVLTERERRGDFSELNRPLRDPEGGVFPGNIIPPNRIFSGARTFIDNYMPLPTDGRRIVVTQVENFDDNQYLGKVDQMIGSKLRLSGRGYWSRANQPGNLNPANFYETTTIRDWKNTSLVGNAQWTVSPTVLNQTVFSYNRTEGPASQVYPDRDWNDLGVNITLDPFTQYHMTFQTISNINTGDTNNFLRDEYQIGNTTRWSRGRHNISFGGEYGYGIGDIVNNFRAQGQFRWAASAPFTGHDVADFMIGKFERFIQGAGEFKDTRFHLFSLFFNDSFNVTRRLNLNLGVRWEPFFPYTDVNGKLAVWGGEGAQSQRFINAPPGILYPGDPGVPDGGFDTSWLNFGPRFGLAWDMTGDGKTSLRLGYGVFFDRSNTISTNSQANQGPFAQQVEIFGNARNSLANPYADFPGGNPFPQIGFDAVGTDILNPPSDAPFLTGHQAFVYAADMRNAYTQSWNVTLEREVFSNWVARLAYVGSKGTALVSGRDFNSPFPNATATTATINQRRPLWPAYGRITMIEPSGLSIYHSLQTTLEKRFSRGFTLSGNYTYGKAIDNNSGSANKATGTSVTDPYNQAFDRGPADYDVTHVANISGIWQMPIRFENRLAQTLIGGWTLTGILTARSGYPFTVGSGQDNARTGQGGQRADLVGDPYFSGDRSRGEMVEEYLRASAFQVNALGTYGTLGRNNFRGPGAFRTDLGLHKNFPITETSRLQFRAEAFNVFNNVNFNLPNSTVTSNNFMQLTSAEPPRILQGALRFEF